MHAWLKTLTFLASILHSLTEPAIVVVFSILALALVMWEWGRPLLGLLDAKAQQYLEGGLAGAIAYPIAQAFSITITLILVCVASAFVSALAVALLQPIALGLSLLLRGTPVAFGQRRLNSKLATEVPY